MLFEAIKELTVVASLGRSCPCKLPWRCHAFHSPLNLPFCLDHTQFRSSFGHNSVANIDYDMTSPLAADGSNFPCKGYQSDFATSDPVATLTAGSNFHIQLYGTATHDGGSCELSVSYDQAATWAVIHRISGGCPLAKNYTFNVPSDVAGSDKALCAHYSVLTPLGC